MQTPTAHDHKAMGHMGKMTPSGHHAVTMTGAVKKPCCGHCGDNCQCKDKSACGTHTSNLPVFISQTGYRDHAVDITRFPVEFLSAAFSQIITPDLRPPIV